MRVLFISYPHVGLKKGGMYIQIIKTAEALRKLNIEVIFQNSWDNQIQDSDICHIFSTNEAVYGSMHAAIMSGKPTIWSTVFSVFKKPVWQLRIQFLLSRFIPGFYSSWKTCRYLLSKCSHIIALNKEEQYRLASLCPLINNKISIIPNGFDHSFTKGDQNLFRNYIGLSPKDPYVLNVATLCENKNQLSIIRAAKGKPWKLILIGPNDNSFYSDLCAQEAKKMENVFILGSLPHGSDLLSSAYAGADVFCLPSFSEVQPLTLFEAAASGCKIVASNQIPEIPWLSDHLFLVSPHNINALGNSIDSAFLSNKNARDVIMQQPTWENIGKMISRIYEKACE